MLVLNRLPTVGKFLTRNVNKHAGKPAMNHVKNVFHILTVLSVSVPLGLWCGAFQNQSSALVLLAYTATLLTVPFIDACIICFWFTQGHTVHPAEEGQRKAWSDVAWRFVTSAPDDSSP